MKLDVGYGNPDTQNQGVQTWDSVAIAARRPVGSAMFIKLVSIWLAGVAHEL